MTTFDAAMGITPEALDQADCARHVIGACILPVTYDDLREHFERAKKGGAVTKSGAAHIDVMDMGKQLKALSKDGWLKQLNGDDFSTFAQMIEACDKDPDIVQNDLDPQDSPHVEPRTETIEHDDGTKEDVVIEAYFQTLTRGAQWAQNCTEAGRSRSGAWFVMTKAGFKLITGHKQGQSLAEAMAEDHPDETAEVPE